MDEVSKFPNLRKHEVGKLSGLSKLMKMLKTLYYLISEIIFYAKNTLF